MSVSSNPTPVRSPVILIVHCEGHESVGKHIANFSPLFLVVRLEGRGLNQVTNLKNQIRMGPNNVEATVNQVGLNLFSLLVQILFRHRRGRQRDLCRA